MTAVWPDSFVEEANLSQNVSVLRKALGDTTQNPRYIITVPGQGYRFAAEVRKTSAGSQSSRPADNSRDRVAGRARGERGPARERAGAQVDRGGHSADPCCDRGSLVVPAPKGSSSRALHPPELWRKNSRAFSGLRRVVSRCRYGWEPNLFFDNARRYSQARVFVRGRRRPGANDRTGRTKRNFGIYLPTVRLCSRTGRCPVKPASICGSYQPQEEDHGGWGASTGRTPHGRPTAGTSSMHRDTTCSSLNRTAATAASS
jgi:hypothetical protein